MRPISGSLAHWFLRTLPRLPEISYVPAERGRRGCDMQCMGEAEDSHFCYVFDTILLRYWGIGGLVYVLSRL